MPRGGVRQGKAGRPYSNRTDLTASTGKPLPIQTPPSTQYGQAAASRRSQAVVPLAPQAAAPPANPAPAPSTGAGPAPVPPGGFGDPLRPTDRPDEPVTAGLPMGPGPGPEALTMNTPQLKASPLQATMGMLASLGDNTSPQIRALRTQLAATIQNSSG